MAVNRQALLKRIGEKRGFRFGVHDFLAEVAPEYLSRFNAWVEYNYLAPRHLDRKTKELIILSVCSALHDIPAHIQIHVKAAAEHGASKEEIMEAITLQSGWSGALGMMGGLEAWRRVFAPDAPSVMEPVKTK